MKQYYLVHTDVICQTWHITSVFAATDTKVRKQLKEAKETLDTNAINFLNWCNTPIYRGSNELGFRKRAVPQFPNYDVYIVIDETGNSIFPPGKFLTSEELYEFWIKNR